MDNLPPFTHRAAMGAILVVAVGIALPAVPLHAQQSKQSALTLEALAAKVKHLEDLQEITNLLNAYGRALDSRDFKMYGSLFSKDGSWSGGMGTVTGGPQAIYDFMTSRIGGGGQRNAGGNANAGGGAGGDARGRQAGGGGGGVGSTYHIMSNFKIDVNGDSATAWSRWTFVSAARGPGIQIAGRYEDTLVREDGAWKFKSRQAFNDVTAPAAAPATAGR